MTHPLTRISSQVLLLILSALMTACVHENEPEAWSLKPGDPLPAFTVVTTQGRTVSDQSFRGKRGAIVFFSTQCADCRRELPRLEQSYRQLLETLPNPCDYELICISREETEEAVSRFWAENGLTMPVAIETDRRIYNLFATTGIPRIYQIQDTRILSTHLETLPPLH